MNAADLPQCEQLVNEENREVDVNCGGCSRLVEFKKEKQAGWCVMFRRMQSTWHQVRCNRFVKKGSE